MPMENIVEIDIDLRKEDWFSFVKYLQRKKQRGLKGLFTGFWGNMILWCILTLIFMFLFNRLEKFHYPTAIFMFVLFLAVFGTFLLRMAKLQKALAPSENGIFIGKHHFRFNKNGIFAEGQNAKSHYQWEAILSVVYEEGMVLLFVDTAHAMVFPERQIGDPEGFLQQIKRLMA